MFLLMTIADGVRTLPTDAAMRELFHCKHDSPWLHNRKYLGGMHSEIEKSTIIMRWLIYTRLEEES